MKTAISQAFKTKAKQSKENELVFMLYTTQVNHLEFDSSGRLALVWFEFSDPQTNELIATEPGMALAHQVSEPASLPSSWQIILRHEENWASAIWDLPDELMNEDLKRQYVSKVQAVPHNTQTFTGYRLPYPQGLSVKLSGSIAHVFIYKTCPSTCLYAFDFWNGEMFPVAAAKGGIVKKAVWEYPNGNTENTNYLLIEDRSTTPTTYQIYYHLAQNSIPEYLRVPGAVVVQGQFIGNADDTGASTSHHLHFQVHTNPNSYWGTSVDITFEDVDVNGGRPRTCKEVELYPEYGNGCHQGDWFISQNTANLAPTGRITAPLENTLVESSGIRLTAEASDDNGVASIQPMLRVGAQGWMPVGSAVSGGKLDTQINFCDLGLPDGIIELGLAIKDITGKETLTTDKPVRVYKSFNCAASPVVDTCEPAPNQIALFTQVNYGGSCKRVDIGNYLGMSYVNGIENDSVRSIKVGNEVYAILFVSTNLKGAQETFTRSDPDLADNPTGNDTVSSLSVHPYPPLPAKPTLPEPFSAVEGDPIIYRWNGDAESYRVTLYREDQIISLQDWSEAANFPIYDSAPGNYTIIVEGRNISGSTSASGSFTITPRPITLPESELLPLAALQESTIFQLTWKVNQAAENIASFDLQYRLKGEESWLDDHPAIPSDKRAEWFTGNPGNTYEFRLRAAAVDGSVEAWTVMPEASTTISASCGMDAYEANSANNTPAGAGRIEISQPQTHNFCGLADIDWVKFDAVEGNQYKIILTPVDGGLQLSAEIVDTNGLTRLLSANTNAEDDGISIDWEAPASRAYFIRVSGEDPRLAGSLTRYEIELRQVRGVLPLSTICGSIIVLLGMIGGSTAVKVKKARKKQTSLTEL
ncbi:MAG: peptidoglycan DD-metalloendopeptidase family protein [Anaerolineaceae bacterium]|nr:peptidoglycan DD-metalloendopeptidase family protein [Anaerolineaceae bacterium]